MYGTVRVRYREDLEIRLMKMAVMFIDIRNFTGFAVEREPADVIRYQHEFLRVVTSTVGRYGGVVHQLLGDGCMVTFGGLPGLGNPARCAVLAGIELLRAMDEARDCGRLPETRVGIGIHYGEVAAGNIGAGGFQQYAVSGSVVILASRMEQLNKQFGTQVLVSAEVVGMAGYTDRAVCLGDVVVKGWGEPVGVFKLA